jgi:predicted PolB exonuclease-like 3'-5' exonuclease
VRFPRAEYLVLDLETVPDVQRWARPDTPEGVEPPFPPTWAHRIVVIGAMWLDHRYRVQHLDVVHPSAAIANALERDRAATDAARGDRPADHDAASGDAAPRGARAATGSAEDVRERALLHELSAAIGETRPVLVTYNGRAFDLPVIALRSLCHAVPMPWYYREKDTRYRYSEQGHLDLCDWLADHGAVRAGKLDAITRLVGLPGKSGMDGSQVEGLYRAGELAAIERYCLADVAQTALLFLRFRVLQGHLEPEEFRARAAELLDRLAEDGRVALDGVDRAQLLATW